MANLFNLTDFQWGLLANDAYRRYELRGDSPELGYDPSASADFNSRRYPDVESNLPGWYEYTGNIIDIQKDIFEELRAKDPNGYDYSGGIVNAFSARVYVNSTTKEVIVSFRGSESLEEISGSDGGSSDALNDWKGNYNAVINNQIHEQVNAAYYFTQELKTILDSDPSLSNYKIAFTGHSLGGYLATAISTIESVQDTTKLPAGGQNAVVFNPFAARNTVTTLFDKGAGAVTETIQV